MLPDHEVLTDIVTTANSLCKSARYAAFDAVLALRPTQHMGSWQDPYKSLSNSRQKPGKFLHIFSKHPTRLAKLALPPGHVVAGQYGCRCRPDVLD